MFFFENKNNQFTLALSVTRSQVGPVNGNLTAVLARISSCESFRSSANGVLPANKVYRSIPRLPRLHHIQLKYIL
jgi:hypothetical protein